MKCVRSGYVEEFSPAVIECIQRLANSGFKRCTIPQAERAAETRNGTLVQSLNEGY